MSLIIAVAQPLIVPKEVVGNAAVHAAAVRSAGAAVVVFPELSLTGYELDADTLRAEDSRLAPIIEACAETGACALVGAPVEGESGCSHIGMLAIDGSGARVVYRKMCIGGEEPRRFTPGDRPAVLEVDGWRLGLAICKDTGISQHAADTAALGMDVYVAGVLEHEADAHVPGERARRIAAEHGVWVAIASYAGSAGGGFEHAAGGSRIWGPGGSVIVQAGPEVGEIVRATLARGAARATPRLSEPSELTA